MKIDKSDQAWMDALAGMPEAGEDPESSIAEARMIRKAVLENTREDRAAYPSPEGFEKLIARARAGDLLFEETLLSRFRRKIWIPIQKVTQPLAVPAFFALFACITLLVQQRTPQQIADMSGEEFAVRGGNEAIVIPVQDLASAVNDWESALLDNHVRHRTLYDGKERVTISVRVSEGAKVALAKLKQTLPAGEWASYEIVRVEP